MPQDGDFALFVASCVTGGLSLLLLGASVAAFLEAGGHDPRDSREQAELVGFWLSLLGNAFGVLTSIAVACCLGSRMRQPARARRKKREKIAPADKARSPGRPARARSLRASPKSPARISREKRSTHMDSSLLIAAGASAAP